jgi:putative addiction module CopG family antidote
MMIIELKPETEALIQQDLDRGPYQNASDLVEQAVALLHEQESWLADNRAELAARIEEGYASAQAGELTDEDEVRARMEEKKRAWLKLQKRT